MKVAEDSAMDARSLATEGKTQAVMIAERLAEDVRECSAALTRKVRLHTPPLLLLPSVFFLSFKTCLPSVFMQLTLYILLPLA